MSAVSTSFLSVHTRHFVAILEAPNEPTLAALSVESVSADLRSWLHMDATEEAANLQSHFTDAASVKLHSRWPTQEEGIEEAYGRTSYLAYSFDGGARSPVTHPKHTQPIRVRIGERNDRMDELLSARSAISATYTTAWNPCSELLPRDINEAAHMRLVKKIEKDGLAWLDHVGRADEGDWEEHGLLVLGWTRAQAIECAGAFAQNAVVWCEPGKPAELIWIFDQQWPASFTATAQLAENANHAARKVKISARPLVQDGLADVKKRYVCTVDEV